VLLPILVAILLPQAAITAGPQYATARASIAVETLKKSVRSTKKKKKVIASRTATKRVASAGKVSVTSIGFTTPASAGALSNDLGTMIDRAARGAKWGVLVVSLTNGDTLFGRNADDQLLPASTMKLFTSSLALERFGTAGRFESAPVRLAATVYSAAILC
jgi:D-alanyl-D-alanine carboxypeptidase